MHGPKQKNWRHRKKERQEELAKLEADKKIAAQLRKERIDERKKADQEAEQRLNDIVDRYKVAANKAQTEQRLNDIVERYKVAANKAQTRAIILAMKQGTDFNMVTMETEMNTTDMTGVDSECGQHDIDAEVDISCEDVLEELLLMENEDEFEGTEDGDEHDNTDCNTEDCDGSRLKVNNAIFLTQWMETYNVSITGVDALLQHHREVFEKVCQKNNQNVLNNFLDLMPTAVKDCQATLAKHMSFPKFTAHVSKLCTDCALLFPTAGPCKQCGCRKSKTVKWVEFDIEAVIKLQIAERANVWLDHAVDTECDARAKSGRKKEVYDGAMWKRHRVHQFWDDDPRHLSLAATADGFGLHRKSITQISLEVTCMLFSTCTASR